MLFYMSPCLLLQRLGGRLSCLAAEQHNMYIASCMLQIPRRELTQAELDTRAFIAHLT